MAPGNSDPTSPRRIRRVAGQRRVAGHGAAAYAPPSEPTAASPIAAPSAAPSAAPTIESPPRPEPQQDKGGRPGRLTGLRARLRGRRTAVSRRPGGRRAEIVGLALIAVVVALMTLVVLLLQGWLHARAVASARDDAVAAATVAVPQVAAYDYRTFDADTARAAKLLTPEFRKAYLDVQQKTVKAPAQKYKASVTADLVAVGPISGNSHDVKLLVFLDQTTKNTRLAAPKLSQNRLRVEMRKVNGHWLIAQLSLF